jgi:hypothetical protein
MQVGVSSNALLEESTRPANSYWTRVARTYAQMRPPLRPSVEDIRFLEQTVAAYALRQPKARQALLLGVTPDIAAMRLPSAFSLLGIDCSYPMVKGVWPRNLPGRRWGINGNWMALPAAPSSCDIVIGDGSMNCLRYPDEHRAFAESVLSVMKPDGIFILRCFAQLENRENADQVFEDALSGRIPTFTQFRYRLLMALQPNAREGIAVKSVYRCWTERSAGDPLLLSRAGWPEHDVDVIELYRDCGAVHTFPTLAECRATLSEFFDEISVSFPTYYAGDRCPRLVLTPRRRGG